MPKARGEGKPYKETRTRTRKNRKTGEVETYTYELWAWKVELDPKPNGERDSITIRRKNRNDLIDAKRELLVKLATGGPLKHDTTTVAEWLEYWLDEVAKPRLRPRVWRDYRSTARRNIIPHIGNVKLGKLEPRHVRHMLAEVTKSGLELRSAEVAYLRLHKAIQDAMREPSLHLDRNVVDLVDKPNPKTKAQDASASRLALMSSATPSKNANRRARHALTTDQARAVLRSAIEHEDPLTARWATALLGATRQGETIGLTTDRIDREARTLDLSWALQVVPLRRSVGDRLPSGDVYPVSAFDIPPGHEIIPLYKATCLVRPKTDESVRVLPIPDPLWLLIEDHLDRMRPNPWGLVWIGANGKPLRPEADRKLWNAALARAGVPDVVLHAARHTTGTLLLEADVPEDIRMAIMGQSSAAAQRMYAVANAEVKREALSKLNGILDPLPTPAQLRQTPLVLPEAPAALALDPASAVELAQVIEQPEFVAPRADGMPLFLAPQ